MDLHSGLPYFLLHNGTASSYGQLHEDLETDTVVLGAGISGALTAHFLTKMGVGCVVLDSRSVAMGSSCASTAMIQYELDRPLFELCKLIGARDAVTAYKMNYESIDEFRKLCSEIAFNSFATCGSIYFSHSRRKNDFIEAEYKARIQAGFDVELLSSDDLFKNYALNADVAIYSRNAAKCDAFLLTRKLLDFGITKGLRVFENSHVKDISYENNRIFLRTSGGNNVTATSLVYATGYEATEDISKKIVQLYSTYAAASQRSSDIDPAMCETLFWNTADPYFYAREAGDRILIGGGDAKYTSPVARDLRLEDKIKALRKEYHQYFENAVFEPEYKWTGTFGVTKDSLPFIGSIGKYPNTHFALGYGGNGMTFSLIAAQLIAQNITTGRDHVPEFFSFKRI